MEVMAYYLLLVHYHHGGVQADMVLESSTS